MPPIAAIAFILAEDSPVCTSGDAVSDRQDCPLSFNPVRDAASRFAACLAADIANCHQLQRMHKTRNFN